MQHVSLHDRLAALGRKIHAAEEKLREEAHLYRDSTHHTAQELKDRYKTLQARLTGEDADAEAHGEHMSDLERSVHQWLDSIDASHTASK